MRSLREESLSYLHVLWEHRGRFSTLAPTSASFFHVQGNGKASVLSVTWKSNLNSSLLHFLQQPEKQKKQTEREKGCAPLRRSHMPRPRCSANQQEAQRDAEPSSTSPKHLAKSAQSLLWYLAFQPLTGACNWGSDLESHRECFASAKNLVAGMHNRVYLYLAREHFESCRCSHDIWSTEA